VTCSFGKGHCTSDMCEQVMHVLERVMQGRCTSDMCEQVMHVREQVIKGSLP
jgi:hypothetical protein